MAHQTSWSIPALFGFLALWTSGASCQTKGTSRALPPLDPALRTALIDVISSEVRAGFDPAEEIVTLAVEIVAEGADTGTVRAVAVHLTDSLLAAHAREQTSWPSPTDPEKLDAGFAALEKQGIVCRQNFSCCGSCGAGEIVEEMEQVQEAGATVRGYAFYHEQDTENATEGNGLYLNYGTADESEAAAIGVAKEIVAALRKEGLVVTWDGTWDTRIHVAMDWRKRR